MNIRNLLLVYKKNYESAHDKSLEIVMKVLDEADIKYDLCVRDSVTYNHFLNRDMIIFLSGDDTLAAKSHYIRSDTPILGINSSPGESTGFFMKALPSDFKDKFDLILNGKYNRDYYIFKLARIESKIKTATGYEISLEPALNEILIANTQQYNPSKYEMLIGRRKEYQISSGVLISTPAGSTAWIKNAGGKVIPLNAKKFQFLVRERMKGEITSAILKKGQTISIKSDMHEAYVILDGFRKAMVYKNDEVVVGLSDYDLSIIGFHSDFRKN